MDISNKVVIITGASSGIGAATARLLATKGAKLVLMSRRLEKMQQLASELNGVEVLPLAVDVQDKGVIHAAVNSVIDRFGTIDVLINNAGTPEGGGNFMSMDDGAFDQIVDTNVKGVLYMTRACLPIMLKRPEAHVVNIGSIGSHLVSHGGGVYCATKHALKAITNGLRYDLLGTEVRVSMISPGFVDTEFVDVLAKDNTERKDFFYKGTAPLMSEDIADAICYSLSCPQRVNIDEILILPTKQAGLELHRNNTDKE